MLEDVFFEKKNNVTEEKNQNEKMKCGKEL